MEQRFSFYCHELFEGLEGDSTINAVGVRGEFPPSNRASVRVPVFAYTEPRRRRAATMHADSPSPRPIRQERANALLARATPLSCREGPLRMAGRRPLTRDEEEELLATPQELNPRDRALVTTLWMTGFPISEVLSLTYGSVWRAHEMLPAIGVAPAHLKGGYGRTRWILILSELWAALEALHNWLRLRFELRHDLPLFVSCEGDDDGYARPLSREQARTIIMATFEKAGIRNDGRLGTHTLRKTWARNVYDAAGKDIMVLRDALGHADIGTSQRYLDVGRDRVLEAIRSSTLSTPSPVASRRKVRRKAPVRILPAA